MAESAQVIVSNNGGLAQHIITGKHQLRADEPAPAGTDTGPSPYELLLAALGSCTSMTLRLYAERKAWDLKRIVIRLQHGRIHAEDCRDCETKEGFLDHVDIDIELEGNLDGEQKQRLLAIAEKCPVHRTLQSEINIRTIVR